MSISANFPNVRPSLLLDFANSQQLDPRVTFSRSTTAPYYDGKTSALAEQNLFTYSAMNNAVWTDVNTTHTTSGVLSPDGVSYYQTITALPNGNRLIQTNTLTLGLTYTASFYVTAGTSNYAGMVTTLCGVIYNLTGSGTVVSNAGANFVSATISLISTGVYRCTMTFTVTSASVQIGIGVSDGSTYYGSIYPSASSGTINATLAQLEQRSSVTAYNPTTTTPITNYIPQLLTAPINQPRFDFNPTTGESLGLLIEQSSTNLVTYSEQFDNAIWGKMSSTISVNQLVAPDGTISADAIISQSATALTGVSQAVSVTSGVSYTASFFVKKKDVRYLQIFWGGPISTNYANFDLDTSTVTVQTTANTAFINSVGNGMYRISLTISSLITSAVYAVNLTLIDTGTSGRASSYTGNGISGGYIWGAQLEALAFPTSYIPTTSAQVTRASDNASMTGTNFSSWYNQGQDTIYASFKKNNLGSNGSLFQVYSSSNNRVAINTITDGTMSYDIYINTGLNNSLSGYTANSIGKSIAVIQSNNYFQSFNGNSSSTIASTMVTATTLSIGNRGATSDLWLNGWISKLAVYPQALTSAQSNALTGS